MHAVEVEWADGQPESHVTVANGQLVEVEGVGCDASLEGNVFGFVAMLLLVAYVVATRHYRRDMDVTTFMATICPIAAVAVLPLALIHGDVFGLSSTGWTFSPITRPRFASRCPRSRSWRFTSTTR